MAITHILHAGFELGLGLTASLTPISGQSNQTGTWTAVAAPAGRWGGMALKVGASQDNHHMTWTLGAGQRRITARFAVYFDTFPTDSGANIFGIEAGAVDAQLRYLFTGGQPRLQMIVGSSSAMVGPAPLVADTWYLVEVTYDTSASPHVMTCKVNGAAAVSVSSATGIAVDQGTIFLGSGFGTPADYNAATYWDDFVVGSFPTAGSPEYWGDGKVVALLPSGRAVAGSAVTMSGDTAVQFGSSGVGDPDLDDVAALLDEIPAEQTTVGATYLSQDVAFAAGSAPDGYLDVPFADTTETIIDGVRAVAMIGDSSSTGSNNAVVGIVDGVPNITNLAYGDPGVGPIPRAAYIAAPGGSWDQAEVNALKVRFGGASDISPVPRLFGAYLEVAATTAPAGVDELGEAALTSTTATLAATGSVDRNGASALTSPAATFAAAGVADRAGAAALTSTTASLTASGSRDRTGAAAFTADASLSGTGAADRNAGAALTSAAGTLGASGDVEAGAVEGEALLAASASLAGTGSADRAGAVSMIADGVLLSAGDVPVVAPPAVPRLGVGSAFRVAELVAREEANNGQVSVSGKVPAELLDVYPHIVAEGSELLIGIRESGGLLASGVLAPPSRNGQTCELTGDGPARWAKRTVGRMFFWSDSLDLWSKQDTDPHRRGSAPDDAPTAALGGAGNVNVGIHRYRVAFVTADGQTRPGPRVEIDVTASAKVVELTNIPKGPGFVTGRAIYRTEAGNSTYKLLTTIANNTATTYSDNTADAGLGATAPTSFERAEISADVEEGGALFSVEKGSDVFDGQMAGIIASVPGQPLQRVKAILDKTRDTTGFTLRLYSADDEDSPFALEESWTLDDSAPGRISVWLANRNATVVRFVLRKEGDGLGVDSLKVTLKDLKLFGIAGDEDYTVDDVVREVGSRMRCDVTLVRSRGIPCGPLDVVGGTYAEVLDLMALMAGWRWLLYRRQAGDRCLDFRPWSARRWILIDPEMPRAWVTQPRYSKVVVAFRRQDGRVKELAEAVADPNPLDEVRTKVIFVDQRVSTQVAKALAAAAVDELVKVRKAGSFTFSEVLDENGHRWPGQFVWAGDEVYDPREQLWIRVDVLERFRRKLTGTAPEGLPALERWQARRGVSISTGS